MKFKIDENLPIELAAFLSEAGYNAEFAQEKGRPKVRDFGPQLPSLDWTSHPQTQPILPGLVTLAAFYAGINRLFLFFMLRNEKGRSLAKNQEILVKITINILVNPKTGGIAEVLVSKAKFATFNRARFARLYYIDQQIRAGKFPNAPKLAKELEIKPRTVERDLELMRDRLGACIAYDHRLRGYYYTSADFKLPPLKLTEGEAVVLFLGQKLLAQCIGTPLENTIRNAFDKVCLLYLDSISVDFSTIERAVSFNVAPLRGDENQVADTFQKLAIAVQDRTTIWLKYFSATRNQATERHVDPYHLRYFQGAWYLIGYCHWRQKVRIFAIDRILSLQETNQPFTPIPGFSLQEFLASSIGIEMDTTPQEVAIRFDSHQARWIRERQWHQSQRLEPQSDGSLILYLTVSGLGEVKRWVLSFGSHAEVLSPLSLRQEVSAEIQMARALYL